VWTLSANNGRLELTGLPPDPVDGASWRPVLPLLQELLEHSHVLEAAGLDGFPLHRSILLHDYGGTTRQRSLVFPFPEGGLRPAAVVKLRDRRGSGRPLRTEWEALRWVRCRLDDAALRETVPEALAFLETPAAEILVLSHLEGRSAYWDQQNRLFPGGSVRRHMEAAADWLARFHRALAMDPTAGRGPSHGDFWARNLLLAPDRGSRVTGLVDWELFDPEGLPHHDLFHFPVTYAQNHPGSRPRRVPLPAAFRRAFLRRTPLSRAVGRYFDGYCARIDIAPRILEPLLRDYLRARAQQDGTEGGEDWLECLDLLDHSGWVSTS